jgi:hypothetical protein
MSRSVLIVAAAVFLQMGLAAWQARAGVDYAKLYEARTGRKMLSRASDPHPIVMLLRPGAGEPRFFGQQKQSEPELERSRQRYTWRRNVFVIGTLLDWAALAVLLSANAR